VKLHDFGLWFKGWHANVWSATIPRTGDKNFPYDIYYDGEELGWQRSNLDLCIHICRSRIIKLKNNFHRDWMTKDYKVGRILTIDDFEIIPNPNYKEIP
jgi:hypothetical protein